MSLRQVRDTLKRIHDSALMLPSENELAEKLKVPIKLFDQQDEPHCVLTLNDATRLDQYPAGSNIHRYVLLLRDLYALNCNNEHFTYTVSSRLTGELNHEQVLGLLKELDA